MINCIVIEDQLPAQRILQTYIAEVGDLNLVGCSQSAMEADQLLRASQVDLIFLDINLPKISGISFLRNLRHPPKVIITSAYAQYALEGFELDVVDYLLKPFSFDRFYKAVSKVMDQLSGNQQPLQRFVFIKTEKELHKVNTEDIVYLKADDSFVRIYTKEKMYIQSGTLQKWVTDLPQIFARNHRSYAINMANLTKISGNRVYLDELELPIGRAYREQFLATIAS